MNERKNGLRWMLLALQGMTALFAAGGVTLSVFLLSFGVKAVAGSETVGNLLLPGALGIAAVLAVSACCLVALCSFFRLCGRIRRETAFTAQNERALGRIAISCGIGGAVCAAAPLLFMSVMRRVLWLYPDASYGSMSLYGTDQWTLPYLYLWLLAFLLLAVGSISRALALLMRRAKLLQEENDAIV